MPLIRLRVDPRRVTAPRGDRVQATITLQPTLYRMHPHVLWAALRVCADSPSERARLGTAFGPRI